MATTYYAITGGRGELLHTAVKPGLQHLRQILAARTAWIIHIVCNLLRALGGQFIEPINELGIAAPLVDKPGEAIAAISPALLAGHAQHIELADEIAEDDCAVARHDPTTI